MHFRDKRELQERFRTMVMLIPAMIAKRPDMEKLPEIKGVSNTN